MKAICWFGKQDIRVEDVDEPRVINPRDALIEVSMTSIDGTDLQIYQGLVPAMESGDILGHEAVGTVLEVGYEVDELSPGDRVIVPSCVACGNCYYCQQDETALCDNSNPNAWMAEQKFGYSPAGVFGSSHLLGGYAGAQAELMRVPYADFGPMKIPDGVSDEEALFLTDAFPTGFQAAHRAGVGPETTVAVWGCGPVGLFAIQSAYLLGATQVIAIDHLHHRLAMARSECNATVLHVDDDPVLEALHEITGGRGPDVCIEAVGMAAHGGGVSDLYDRALQTLRLERGRPHALRQAIMACRKGGTVAITGLFDGPLDRLPMGAAFHKGLKFEMGPPNIHRYQRRLMDFLVNGDIDPTFLITHRIPLIEGAAAYEMLHNDEDNAVKIALRP